MTAQVAPVADRADLTVTVAPGAGRGAPACFVPASAEIEVNGDHLGVDPATADPASPADRERYPALWGATVNPPPEIAAALDWAERASLVVGAGGHRDGAARAGRLRQDPGPSGASQVTERPPGYRDAAPP